MVDGSKKQIPGGDLGLLPNLEICNSNPLAGWMLRVNRLIWILVQPSYTLKKAQISSPSTYHLSMLKRPVCVGVICHNSDIWHSHLIWFRQLLLSSFSRFSAKTTPSSNHEHLLDFSSFFFLAVHGGQNLHIFCAHLHRLIAAQSIAQITTYSPPNTSLEHRPRAIC